jgi:Chalcone isomerase-like
MALAVLSHPGTGPPFAVFPAHPRQESFPMTMRRRTLLAGLLLLPPVLQAQETPLMVEGRPFERRARVGGAELLLNGTGVRAVAWFKGYAAGLYLRGRASAPAQVLAMPGPKRLQIRMLQEVPAEEFIKAFKKGVARNTPAEALPLLSARMERFEALIAALRTVRKTDVVDLDQEAGGATAFRLNGTLQGEVIAGEDFYAALLRSFVGERPYDDRLKAGLLGQPS